MSLLLLVLPPLASLSLRAAPAEITIKGDSKFPIALESLKGNAGDAATGVITKDLQNAGGFSFESNPNGAYVASGYTEGSRIHGTLISPSGNVLFSNSYGSPNLRLNAHLFADEIVKAITGRPGIASGQIAFVATKSGRKEIYLCNSDGSNIRRVTRDNFLCVAPSISSNGAFLAYTGYRSGYADIYYTDLRTGESRRIIDAPGTNTGAAISPKGRKIALTMSYVGNPELFLTSTRGGRGKRLTHSSAVEASPTWSPDGARLAYCSNARGNPQIFIIKASGGKASPLKTGFRYCTEPTWSPDGQSMAFVSRGGGKNSIAIFSFLTKRGHIIATGEDPAWGADSRHLIYSRGSSLVVTNIDSGAERTIVSQMGRVSEPSWTR